MGAPCHEPTEVTRAQVSSLVAFGIPQNHIARMIGISDDTLRKYYDDELELGLSDANQKVANVLYSKAVDERDLSACIFWLKTRGRKMFSEKELDETKKALEQYQSIVESLLDKIK